MTTKTAIDRKGKVQCLIVRRREDGGIEDEWIPENDVPKGAIKWSLFGKKLPVLVENLNETPESDEIKKSYQAYRLPDEVEITPEKVARIPGCPPWQRYKTTIKTRWEQMKPMIPVLVIIIDAIILVMMKG